MCICHGSFHSPAEFVKHAGGTDTTNPLKHIVVNPNSSSLVFLASNPPVFEFLEKDIRGGSCCVTAFVHKGDLVVSNAGDCRAVMSQGGVAEALTVDHRPSLIEERERIESLSGYVDCCDGGEYIDLLLYPEQLEIAI